MALLALGAIVAGVLAWQAATGWIPGPSASTATGSVQALYDMRATETSSQPVGVAVSGDRVYVADARRGVVEVFTRDGGHLSTIGAGFLKAPVHVAVGPVDGRVYVSDRGRDAVVVYAADGEQLRILGPGGIEPTSPPVAWRPLALGFGDDGTLYVADASERQQIVVFSPTGRRMASFGADLPAGRTGASLAFANGMAVTDDRVLIADSNNGRILVLDREGRFVRALQVDGLPRGIAATGDGGFVVADAALNTVCAYSAAGARVAVAGSGGVTAGLFSEPSGVAIGDDGRIFVGNTGAGRVQVIRMTGAAPRATVTSGRTWMWAVLAAALAAGAVIVAVVSARLLVQSRARRRVVTL